MRIVEEVPHKKFKITVFSWNGKYLLKIELGPFEQTFKIPETEVRGTAQLKEILSDNFLENTYQRFLSMRQDFTNEFQKLT